MAYIALINSRRQVLDWSLNNRGRTRLAGKQARIAGSTVVDFTVDPPANLQHGWVLNAGGTECTAPTPSVAETIARRRHVIMQTIADQIHSHGFRRYEHADSVKAASYRAYCASIVYRLTDGLLGDARKHTALKRAAEIGWERWRDEAVASWHSDSEVANRLNGNNFLTWQAVGASIIAVSVDPAFPNDLFGYTHSMDDKARWNGLLHKGMPDTEDGV